MNENGLKNSRGGEEPELEPRADQVLAARLGEKLRQLALDGFAAAHELAGRVDPVAVRREQLGGGLGVPAVDRVQKRVGDFLDGLVVLAVLVLLCGFRGP